MATFRGSDEAVEREIATLEQMARIRLRRYAAEMRELDRDLSEVRREKARRRVEASVPGTTAAATASA